MRLQRRAFLIAGLIVLVAVAAFAGGMATAQARAAQATPAPGHAQQVVNRYLTILNAGMSTPACDFSGMATVYAPNARVNASAGPFAPGGPFGSGNAYGAQEFDGIQAITGFYTKLCHVLHTKGLASPAWTQDKGFSLAPMVLNSYEHVSSGGNLVGRCMHVFTVVGDQITSLDWVVYQ
jgi:hypothetical protein